MQVGVSLACLTFVAHERVYGAIVSGHRARQVIGWIERKRQLLGDTHLLLQQLGREIHEALLCGLPTPTCRIP
jgi:hypothetical protein